MKKILRIMFFMLLCIGNINTVIASDFEGEGTKESPYKLFDYKSFEKLEENVLAGNNYSGIFFEITNDIKFENNWRGIGGLKEGENDAKNGSNICSFSGIINGNNKKLSFAEDSKPLFNYVRNANIENVNLYCKYFDGFALVDNYVMDYGETGRGINNAKDVIHINNVNLLEGSSVKNGGYIGVVKNYPFGISIKNEILIENCKIEKNIKIGVDKNGNSNNQNKIASFAGEFVGEIRNCESYATIYGRDYVGGIAAVESNAMGKCILDNNKFGGNIISAGKYVGGILGSGFNKNMSAPNAGNVNVLNNKVSKDVIIDGKDYVGGIIGNVYTVQNWNNSKTIIKNNIAECKFKNSEITHLGAIVGELCSINKNCEIDDNCYGSELKKFLPFGKVKYIDTNKIESGVKGDVLYINTENNVENLPVIDMDGNGNMSWKKKQNRTDDPFGADIKKLAKQLSEK